MLRALHCFVHVPRRTEPGTQAQIMWRLFMKLVSILHAPYDPRGLNLLGVVTRESLCHRLQ